MGYKIEFHSMPHHVTWPRTFMPIAQQESVQVEVDKMILQGAIHPVTSNTEGGFVSSIFLVDKKDGVHRPVINLKNLNFFVDFHYFKMEGIHMLWDLLKEGDFDKTGPQRCILYCPSLDRVSKVHKVPMEGNSMGICMPPLWAGQCSQNIHKNHETCGGNTAEFRDALDYISR